LRWDYRGEISNHRGNTGDGLGHGTDAEDGISPHRLAGLAIAHALGAKPGDLGMTNDQSDGASDTLVADVPSDGLTDAFETLG
jgi:hypothetical protein